MSGVVYVPIPGVGGLAIFSPPLDKIGNSVRAIEFCKRFVAQFPFHMFSKDIAVADPLGDRQNEHRSVSVFNFMAATGDLNGIATMVSRGVDMNAADYDGRCAIHLAASEGQTDVVRYFIKKKVNLSVVDRWGGTPLDDAKRGDHQDIVNMLVEAQRTLETIREEEEKAQLSENKSGDSAGLILTNSPHSRVSTPLPRSNSNNNLDYLDSKSSLNNFPLRRVGSIPNM